MVEDPKGNQDQPASPKQPEEGWGLESTIALNRSEFLDPDSFSDIKDMPYWLAGALINYAADRSIKGLAVTASGTEPVAYLTLIQDYLKSKESNPLDMAKSSLHTINLQMNSVYLTYVNVEGKPFEDIEAELRDATKKDPRSIFVGVFRFID